MTRDAARGVSDIFDPKRLTLGRELAGYPRNELAERVAVSPAAISQFELGTSKPGPATVARLGLALRLPVEFFSAGRPMAARDLATAHFRSLRSVTQVDRRRALALAGLTWEVARQVDKWVILPPLDLPSLPADPTIGRDGMERAAADVRSMWGVPGGPIADMTRLLESHGLVVARPRSGTTGVDAFSQSFPHRPVVCLYADKGDPYRSRYDAAHELGHLVLHRDGEVTGSEAERQANEFAAAFLMPRVEISDYLLSRVKWDVLLELKQVWGVSMKAILMRSRSIGRLSEGAFVRAMKSLASRGWHVQEPGEFRGNEQPTMLSQACRLLQDTAPIRTLTDIAEALRLPCALVAEIVGSHDDDRPVLTIADDRSGDEGLSKLTTTIGSQS